MWVNVEEVYPNNPGKICVMAEGWRTLVPIFLEWDGKTWIGLAEMKRHYDNANIYWYKKDN